jgi:hypothetical protein
MEKMKKKKQKKNQKQKHGGTSVGVLEVFGDEIDILLTLSRYSDECYAPRFTFCLYNDRR